MLHIIIYSFLIVGMTESLLSAQEYRTVIRTNRQGQAVRLTVDENRRIIRQEILDPQDLENEPNTADTSAAQPSAPRPNRRPPETPAANRRPAAGRNAPPASSAYHLVGLSFDFLLQSGQGFSSFSTQLDPTDVNTIYTGDLPSWGSGNIRVGVSAGLNYAYVSSKFAAFLFQLYMDTTGWTFGGVNFGLGLKFPVHPKFILAVDTYFAFGMTGAVLPSLEGATIPAGNPESITSLLALFGFKTRVALEFPLPKNTYISLSISYTAYPWGVSSARGTFSLNEIPLGTALVADGLKIGFEFGWKIPVSQKNTPRAARPAR